jgi:hypothetical protein
MKRECKQCKSDFAVASKYSNRKFCSNICRFKNNLGTSEFSNDCLIWPKSLNVQTGYGQFNPSEKPGKMISAHKFSFLVFNGEIPKGLYVRHSCDNRACVNPRHLLLGTQADNVRDMWDRGRQQDYRNCPKGDKNPSRTNPERLARGENHHCNKLREIDVKEIRVSNLSHTSLAKIYGVSPQSIAYIRQRKTWKHVP